MQGETKNRMDKEKFEFYERVRKAYLELAEKEKNRFRIIDGTQAISEIQKNVVETVAIFLN
jgi:dTMP kinase